MSNPSAAEVPPAGQGAGCPREGGGCAGSASVQRGDTLYWYCAGLALLRLAREARDGGEPGANVRTVAKKEGVALLPPEGAREVEAHRLHSEGFRLRAVATPEQCRFPEEIEEARDGGEPGANVRTVAKKEGVALLPPEGAREVEAHRLHSEGFRLRAVATPEQCRFPEEIEEAHPTVSTVRKGSEGTLPGFDVAAAGKRKAGVR